MRTSCCSCNFWRVFGNLSREVKQIECEASARFSSRTDDHGFPEGRSEGVWMELYGMKRTLGYLVFSLGVGALLLFLLGKGCSSPLPAKVDAGVLLEQSVLRGASTTDAGERELSASVRLVVQENSHDALPADSSRVEHRTIRCEVQDESSEDPLAATVRMDAHRWKCAEDGTALIPYESGSAFVVHHEGYEAKRVEFPASCPDVLRVGLKPAGTCTIEVVNELGVLQSAAEIRKVSASSGADDACLPVQVWSRTVAHTGRDGRASVGISGVAWVFAVMDGRSSGLVPLQASEAPAVVITLDSQRATQLALRGPDGAPVQAMHVRAREGASLGLPAIDLVSDTAGLLTGPLPLGAYVLDVPWGIARLAIPTATPTSSVAQSVFNLSRSVRVVRSTDDRAQWIEVQRSSELLIEVRDPSGSPVQPLEIWEEFGNEFVNGDRQWCRVQSPGSVRVPGNRCSLSIFDRPKRLGAPDYRVVVASAGYRPGLLTSPLIPGPDGVCRLTLEPETGVRSLRIVNASGAPHHGRIRVREAGRVWNLFDGIPDPRDGRVGPFSFAGPGELEVLRSSGPVFQVVGRVPFKTLAQDPITVVVVDGSASIRIQGGAARSERLQVVGRDRRVWWGEEDERDLVFAGLWPGRYAVVDSIQIRSVLRLVGDMSLNMTSRTPEEILPIELHEGEERRVDLPAPSSDEGVAGRLDLPPELDGPLFVYVLSSGDSLPRRADARDVRCPVTPSGSYSLERLPFASKSLVLARIDDAGWVVPLMSFASGETPRLRGARVILHLSGLADFLCQGSVEWDGTRYLTYQLATGTERIDLGWFPEGALKVRIVDSQDRYLETLVQVPGEGTKKLERAADAETRSSWARIPETKAFGR